MFLFHIILTHLLGVVCFASTYNVKEIKLVGLNKTHQSVVLNELSFKEGEVISREKIEQGVTDLLNTNLFSSVDYHVSSSKSNDTLLVFTFVERWTTIPILKFASGGGASQTTLGVYDPNIGGRFVEAGVQYERLESTNSGVVWFKNPRLFGKQQGLDIQLWKTNRLRTKYEQDIKQPLEKTAFLHTREKLYFNYFKQLERKIKVFAFYEYNQDEFSDDLVSDEVKNKATQFFIPPNTTYHFLGLGLDWGKINFESYKVDGLLSQINFKYGLAEGRFSDDFSQLDFNFRYYKTLNFDITFAQRLMAGVTDTEALQYWYYLGGLDRVRGFSDNRFSGKYYWLSNSEVRLPVFKRESFVVQATSFVDVASANDNFSDYASIDGLSVGAGLRLFLPKVYRFVLRFDYAVPIIKEDDLNFSFGVQQFF